MNLAVRLHPTAIAHGLIAHEFLTTMQKAGVPDGDPAKLDLKSIVIQCSNQDYA
ncbi:hypothetical protein [Spirosoma endbachense]|uniref:Uncharacterized protein n=1 Tax=Spirosoma endbachense TaxID=2666025 RepID=A0A6P1WA18_9BACT|nr:hypothetical protein [Spirosoma endbachense]QHW00587.1 hypothetical protein GJR95_38660 [Spirosoma endbachense]